MSTVQLRKASDMAESRPVLWRLAPGYLAAGKVNLLVGAEGIGKSLWAIRAVHRSQPAPHGGHSPRKSILPTPS